MHEMALTESILGLIEDEARASGFTKVKLVRLEVGTLSHVSAEALVFCFDAVTRGTIAEGAALDIVAVEGSGWCLDCSQTVPLAERFGACPLCGNHHVQMTTGDELRVKELEVE